MSKCTLRNSDFLESVVKCSKCQREKILSKATKDNINSITEIARNTLKGNLKYSKGALKKLKRYKEDIRKIAKKTFPLKKKKKILQQRGGFIPALIGPVLAAIISDLVSKAVNQAF